MERGLKTVHLKRILPAAALLLMAFALTWWLMVRTRPTPVLTPMYFYDLNRQTLIIDTHDNIPPFSVASGGSAVAAHVYSCTACTDDEQFIAYLTKYDDATREALAAMPQKERTLGGTELQQMMQQGQLIRRLEDDQWVTVDSDAGMTILQSPPLRCGNPHMPVMVCVPASVD